MHCRRCTAIQRGSALPCALRDLDSLSADKVSPKVIGQRSPRIVGSEGSSWKPPSKIPLSIRTFGAEVWVGCGALRRLNPVMARMVDASRYSSALIRKLAKTHSLQVQDCLLAGLCEAPSGSSLKFRWTDRSTRVLALSLVLLDAVGILVDVAA